MSSSNWNFQIGNWEVWNRDKMAKYANYLLRHLIIHYCVDLLPIIVSTCSKFINSAFNKTCFFKHGIFAKPFFNLIFSANTQHLKSLLRLTSNNVFFFNAICSCPGHFKSHFEQFKMLHLWKAEIAGSVGQPPVPKDWFL